MSTAAHGTGEPRGDGLRERETVRTGGRHGGESASSRATSASTKDEDAAEAPRNGSDFAHLFVFANEKAGMKKVDKEHVNQIVFEMSKGSEHFKEAQRRDERTQAEVRKLRAKLAATLESDLAPVRHRVDAKVTKLLRERDLSRIYCVVDMDCFFAAVEMRDDPSLAGKPMAVGGLSMISTTNYLAREYGVRSAMPGFIARKLCPELVFVKSNFDKYRQASQEVRDILKKYDPKLHAGSLDEAYMDITDFVDAEISKEQDGANLDADAQTARRFHVAERVVQAMRDEVSAHTRLTCSAGIARTRMLAKIASDRNKPNGQCVVPWQPEKMLRFTRELAIRKVPGIGKVAEKKLKDALGVATVRDLWDKRYLCAHLLSAVQADYLLRVTLCCTNPSASSSQASSSSASSSSSSAAAVSALPSAFGQGEDNQRGRKSIGMERTFSQGASSVQELFDTCLDICARLSRRCVEKQLIGHCVTLKIKKSSFEVFTRQTVVTNAVPRRADGTDLFEHARELLAREMPCRLRLMGIKVSKLIDPSHAPVTKPPTSRSAQANIKAIFAHPPKEGEPQDSGEKAKGECPVCAQPLNAFSTTEATRHVDACLNNTQQSPPTRDSNKRSTSSLASSEKAAHKKRARSSVGLRAFWTDEAGNTKHQSPTKVSGHSKTDTVCLVDRDSPGKDRQQRCPVCGQTMDGASNAEMNRHLDACLMK